VAIILDLRHRVSHAGIPLMHPTSEHVVLANVFGVLKNLSPNAAINPWLSAVTASRVIASNKWRFSFWQRQHKPIGSIEGSTEVDLVIESEAFVTFVEAKMNAAPSNGTKADPERNQLVRNLDVGYRSAAQQGKAFALVYVTPDSVGPDIIARIQTQPICFPANPKSDEEAIKSCLYWSSWGAVGNVLGESVTSHRLTEIEQSFALDVLAYLACKRLWRNTLPDDQVFYEDNLYHSLRTSESSFVPYSQQNKEGYQAWRRKPWDESGLRLFLAALRPEYQALLKLVAEAGGALRQRAIMEQLPFLRGKSSRSLGGIKSHINAGCKQRDCAPILSEGSGSGDRRLHEINRELGELRGVVVEVSRQFEIPWYLFS
jgi:hypothetical protein